MAANYLITRFAIWLRQQQGQDLAEYAILAALIALAVVATLPVFGEFVNNIFLNIASEIASVF